ncbi:MAG TPA: potassium-transporting ATPase subunit C [Gemmataceae bacterium]|nr:potassium-transporting ATPase subunit C [Gemmataceae bacterium]
MFPHLRANLWLLCTTLVLCCVVYPLILWAFGQTFFPEQAEGSLVRNADGKLIGSRLIAQPFSKDEYFQPRPSAASYKADASGASNWGASNALLRDRVARQLGPMLKYRSGPHQAQPVAADVEAWFKTKPNIVAEWAEAHESAAKAWVNADDKHKDAVTQWQNSHPAEVAKWKEANPDSVDSGPADLAKAFFTNNAPAFHASWPKLVEDSNWSIAAVYFDMWLQEHQDQAQHLEHVPADMVMASGSGLDPHITLQNALFQLDRVAQKWAETAKRDEASVHREIETLVREKTEAPFGGLVGVELVNVLELNLALRNRFGPAGGLTK